MKTKSLMQAEKRLGIKTKTIKYYFKEGLLKQYPEKPYALDRLNCFKLKLIIVLRSLNFSVLETKEIIQRKRPFKKALEKKEIELNNAHKINEDVLTVLEMLGNEKLNDTKINTILKIIEKAPSKSFYSDYKNDYKLAFSDIFTRDFTFIISDLIKEPKEIIEILKKEANNVHKEIEFINVSLTPDFYLDGILYSTKLIPTEIRGKKYQKIYCYQEDIKKMGINSLVVKESKFLKFIQRWWLIPAFLGIDLIIYLFLPFARHTSNLIILLILIFIEVISTIIYQIYFNDRTRHKFDNKN